MNAAIAAGLLAVALTVGTGPLRVRLRAGLVRTPRRVGRARRRATDPLATGSAFDVFSVCLAAGMSVSAAAAATAPSAPGALAEMLRRAAGLLALGAAPDIAWPIRGEEPGCEALARLARRSACSGSALAQGAAELAAQSRREAANAAAAAAERAGVLIAGPLGLCFLPGFFCLGIVPVVAGLAGDVFTAGLQ